MNIEVEDASIGDSLPEVLTIRDKRPPPVIPDCIVNVVTVVVVILVSSVLIVIGVSFGRDVERAITALVKKLDDPSLRKNTNHVATIMPVN